MLGNAEKKSFGKIESCLSRVYQLMFNLFTGKIRCCFFRICAFQYFILCGYSELFTRTWTKITAGSVSSEGDSIFYSGISAVKSGSHVLKLYGD